jgi:hypothetical protein
MCVFHSSQFTFMTRNQAAQPPNIIVGERYTDFIFVALRLSRWLRF